VCVCYRAQFSNQMSRLQATEELDQDQVMTTPPANMVRVSEFVFHVRLISRADFEMCEHSRKQTEGM
jgi:hypothetical protein